MTIRDALALTEDQRVLRDTLRDILADQLPLDVLRGVVKADPGYRPELHARLTRELGLAGLTVPAKFGGLGLGQVEACVVHTELGRALYPGPFLSSSLAAGVLLAAGDRTAAERWLPLLADGSVTGTIAAADKDGRWSSGPGSVRAHLTPHGWRLYGSSWYVIAAQVAHIIVVSARAGTVPAMFLVEAGDPGLRTSAQRGLDLTRRIGVTTFDATPAVLLSQGERAAAALDQAEREFLLATAAEAVGGIGWCLDAAVAYPKERMQFGRPVVSFQEIARACVDMLAAFQDAEITVRLAVAKAAAAAADGAADAPTAAREAALRAGQDYRTVTEAAIHLFTAQHDAYLYYRRAWSAERLSGGPQAHRAYLAALDQPAWPAAPGWPGLASS
jgi:alkylation response protein AidB-like acyl-CoA dehydrogenase